MADRTHVNLLVKYILFFFNFAIFLLSGAVTGLMTWILIEKKKTVENAYDFFLDPSCVMCLVGAIGFFISFFGWFGSLREHITSLKIIRFEHQMEYKKKILHLDLVLVISKDISWAWCKTMYRYTLLFLFLVEVAAIILIFVIVYVPDARDQLNIYPEDSLKKAVVLYRDDEDMQDLIDGIQELLECCGTSNDAEGYKDWTQNAYFNCSQGRNVKDFGEYCSVPFSCCKKKDTGLVNYLCGRDMQSSDMDPLERDREIHTRGCFKAITQILEDNVLIVGGVCIGILIPQMLLTAMTMNLIQQIKMQMAKWNRLPQPIR